MLTQKYKQQQQQVRVISNESAYSSGMYYTDFPLSEGYAKVLLNFNIDSATGKLTPRKGLQSVKYLKTDTAELAYSAQSRNNILHSNTSMFTTENTVHTMLQHVLYNPNVDAYSLLYHFDDTDTPLNFLNLTKDGTKAVLPLQTIAQPGVHGKRTAHDQFFEKPIGTFAFTNSYYTFLTKDGKTKLCYTKLGKDIQPDEVLLDSTSSLNAETVYTCVIDPVKNNPTEAASWGYNMLLEDPYDFVCENTAINLVTITGILPYSEDGKIVLTPRKNQEITLKGFYRAPDSYISDLKSGRFYATTKKDELAEETDTTYAEYNFGDWYIKDEQYYMVMPAGNLNTKKLALYGTTKPGASVKLNVLPETQTESSIRVRWQIKTSNSATWTDIYNEVFTLTEYYTGHGNHTPFMVKTTMPDDEVLVKLTISDPLDTVSTEEYILSTNTIGISTVSDDLANTLNLTPEKYDLSKCTGMLEWDQRLVVWGVPKALNTLFVSDINNPGYFPYPNNIDTFAEPIVSVHSYGNELLVLTTSALYRLSWDSTGAGWTHTLVQRNLHIKSEDTPLTCIIKNMFFFKSGEYYYMMVPKSTTSASVTGETTIAPISKTIEKLLDNFHEIVYNLIKVIVDIPDLQDFTDNLVNYYTYADNTQVVVNYVYDFALDKNNISLDNIEKSKYFYVQLIYDTDLRTWSLQVFESAHMLHVTKQDVVQQDQFVDITPVRNSTNIVLQYYKFQNIKDTGIQYFTELSEPVEQARIIKNYQYLDTGNREINTELKKRFRELQFKIKNTSLTDLELYTGFYIDGSSRTNLLQYVPKAVQDTASGENIIVVDQLLENNTLLDDGELHPTTLNAETKLPCWTLNQSAFPGRTLWKIRIPISGKGYAPRAVILSKNEEEFELLGHSWVYRTMNAR